MAKCDGRSGPVSGVMAALTLWQVWLAVCVSLLLTAVAEAGWFSSYKSKSKGHKQDDHHGGYEDVDSFYFKSPTYEKSKGYDKGHDKGYGKGKGKGKKGKGLKGHYKEICHVVEYSHEKKYHHDKGYDYDHGYGYH